MPIDPHVTGSQVPIASRLGVSPLAYKACLTIASRVSSDRRSGCEETTMWLIEITVAGRRITRRLPGKRRELFGIGERGLPSRPALLFPSA